MFGFMNDVSGLYIVRPFDWKDSKGLGLCVLSEDEVIRARGLRLSSMREAYVFCRVLLRALVSAHTGVPIDQVEIGIGEHGKPEITWPNEKHLEFNISHSRGASVLAVSSNGPIGVDIVEVAEVPEREGFARRVLTDREFGIWSALQVSRRAGWLGRAWAAKEAYLKWLGVGLNVDPRTVEVYWSGDWGFGAMERGGVFPSECGNLCAYEGYQIAIVPSNLDLQVVLEPPHAFGSGLELPSPERSE